MLLKIKKRAESRSISISQELYNQIKETCKDNISVSSFIKIAVKKELKKRGVFVE
jgi:hypothetical protein